MGAPKINSQLQNSDQQNRTPFQPTFATAENNDFTPVSHRKRFIAAFLDGIFSQAVVQLMAAIVLKRQSPTALIVYFVLSTGLMLFYYVGLPISFGASPGKKIMGIKIVNTNGSEPSVGTLLFRETFGKWISYVLFSAGLIAILVSKDRTSWHDRMTKTRVVES